jgi:hypothetical protein
MNSDSTLDRVVKGDALLDGFTLSAPDEQWLLERFIDTLTVDPKKQVDGTSLVLAEDGGSRIKAIGSMSSGDALADRLGVLSRAPITGVAQRASLAGLEEARLNETAHHSAARAEAAALMRAVHADASMPALIAALRGPTGAASDSLAALSSKVGVLTTSRPPQSADPASRVPAPPVLRPCTLSTVPWAPVPQGFSLRVTIPSAWQQEAWFGPAAATPAIPVSPSRVAPAAANLSSDHAITTSSLAAIGAASPASPPRVFFGAGSNGAADVPVQHISSLGQFQPLSPRAELVLALRRIYEHLHIGGYQQLLPPPTPELARRFRRIAEHVPSSLRETLVL